MSLSLYMEEEWACPEGHVGNVGVPESIFESIFTLFNVFHL